MVDNIKRGDIFYIKPISRTSPNATDEFTERPAVIVSNDQNNKYSNYIEVVYLTTRYKQPLPTHVEIKSAAKPSTVLCENVNTVNIERIGDYMGAVTAQELDKINKALIVSLGLENAAGGGIPAEDPTPAAPESDIYKTLYESLLEKVINKI